jgi:hypothetical protein
MLDFIQIIDLFQNSILFIFFYKKKLLKFFYYKIFFILPSVKLLSKPIILDYNDS